MSSQLTPKSEPNSVNSLSTLAPLDEIEGWFDQLLPRELFYGKGIPSFHELARGFQQNKPPVNIIELDEEVILQADLPGYAKDDIEISITERSVTIKSSTEFHPVEQKGNFYRRETDKSTFSRIVGLPSTVDTDNVKASLENGVLELTLPKTSTTKRRTIKLD